MLGLNIDAGPVARATGAAALLSAPHTLTSACATTEALQLADLSASGSVISRTRLEDDAVVVGEDVASNRRGDVAAAWIDDTGDDSGNPSDHDTLRAYFAPAAGNPGADVTIATLASTRVFIGAIGSVVVTLDDRGDALVAYSTYSQVLAVTLGRGGVLGPTQILGPCDTSCELSAGEAPNGRAVIAWGSQAIGGDGAVNPYVVRAAIRRGPGRPFMPSRVLDPGGLVEDQASGPPEVAIAPDGRAVLEWGNVAGANAQAATQPIRAAIAPPGGSFGSIFALTPNGYTGSVAIRSDGATLITWVQTPNQDSTAQYGPIRAILTPARYRRLAAPISLPGITAGIAPHATFTPAGDPLVVSGQIRSNGLAVAISTGPGA